jgi:SAM-dependent methyltransferase
MQIELTPTGERMVVQHYQHDEQHWLIHLFHIVAYRFAETFTTDKNVLDYGCGSGYGSAMIAEAAHSVVAVDVARDAVEYGIAHHAKRNLEFRVIQPDEALPFGTGQFDTVLSFQVIEHLHDPDAYLREVVRVLGPGGTLVLATPDRRTRLLPLQRPWNRWHLTEYSERSLSRLLSRHFTHVDIYTMGGEKSVLDIELRRARRLMWFTLPFTLPFMPDRLRIAALRAGHAAKRRWRPKVSDLDTPRRFQFSERDLSIGRDLWPSVNLVAVARRR